MEQLVRLRLGQRENTIAQKYVNEHPELKVELDSALQQYRAAVDSAQANMADKVSEELKSHGLADEIELCVTELMPMFKNLTHSFAGAMAAQLTLDSIVAEAGKSYYANDSPEPTISDDSLKGLVKTALTPNKEAAQVCQVIVSRLTDKAERYGIEAAMSDKAVYAAWREIFPTKESHVQYFERQVSASKAALGSLGSVLAHAMTATFSHDEDCSEEDSAKMNIMANVLIKTFFESIIKPLPYEAMLKMSRGISEIEAVKIYARAKGK